MDRARLSAAARVLGLTVGGLRALLGVAALASPRLVASPWIGPGSADPGPTVLGRALGGRDLALGLGALASATDAAALRRWCWAAGLADGVDVVATLLGFAELPRRGRLLVLAAAGGGALASAAAAAALGDAAPGGRQKLGRV